MYAIIQVADIRQPQIAQFPEPVTCKKGVGLILFFSKTFSNCSINDCYTALILVGCFLVNLEKPVSCMLVQVHPGKLLVVYAD